MRVALHCLGNLDEGARKGVDWPVNPLVRTLGVMAGISILSACTPSEQTLTAEGKRVFSAKGCSDCHASGSSRGPDLSHIGEQKSRSALETWVRNRSC